MIKRIGYFLLGFVIAMILLFYPRGRKGSDLEPEELYDAEFWFGLQDTKASMIEQLEMAGYDYMGELPLPHGDQYTQWLYKMEDAPKWAVENHFHLLVQIGVEPGVKVTRKSDGANVPWV